MTQALSLSYLSHLPEVDRQELLKLLSPIAISNLFTMGATADVDPRQKLPEPYTMPPAETRVLRARLCVEEVVDELCEALGVEVQSKDMIDFGTPMTMKNLCFEAKGEPNLDDAIDACIDGMYVLVGTLCAMGVPDLPHIYEVNLCNDAKFPDGVAVANKHGKFQKPQGWQAPNHAAIQRGMAHLPRLAKWAERLVAVARAVGNAEPNEVPVEHREHGNKQSS